MLVEAEVFIAYPNEQRYAGIAESIEARRTLAVWNGCGIRKINHSLQVQVLASIFIELLKDTIGISDGIFEIQDVVLNIGFSPNSLVCRVTVQEIEMTSF